MSWSGMLALPAFVAASLIVGSEAFIVGRHVPAILAGALVLGVSTSGAIAKLVHSQVSGIAKEPYVLTSVAKGLTPSQTLCHHILRPTAATIVTFTALQIGFLLGGSILIESILSIPGVGLLITNAAIEKDVYVVLGVVLVVSTVYSLSNQLAEYVQQQLDPRLANA
jgi:ABC-type dipeptide/oligopeptide/nickel transport system permease component